MILLVWEGRRTDVQAIVRWWGLLSKCAINSGTYWRVAGHKEIFVTKSSLIVIFTTQDCKLHGRPHIAEHMWHTSKASKLWKPLRELLLRVLSSHVNMAAPGSQSLFSFWSLAPRTLLYTRQLHIQKTCVSPYNSSFRGTLSLIPVELGCGAYM